MHRVTLYGLILYSHTIFTADPHQELRESLKNIMSPEDIEKIILEDMAARTTQQTHIRSDVPAQTNPIDRKAFEQKMALRARNAKFGQLGM